MAQNPIQWFPGHMAKTVRMMKDCLGDVDIIIELLDARIPYSSKNPEISDITDKKPSLTILNKSSLASQEVTDKWIRYYSSLGKEAISVDCINGSGIAKIEPAVRKILAEKIKAYENKGMVGRKLRAMVVGIPNVGKSSLINKLCGSRKAKVENRPGVTLDKQWIQVSPALDLMDMPGVLWPKFEEKKVGENLAITGAIKDDILDTEQIAVILCARLKKVAPELFMARYKISRSELDGCETDYEILELVGKKRGFLISGGEIDTERASNMLLDEFRGAKIGRISLEAPNTAGEKNA